MPTPLAKGIIIAASVLVAAGLAAYENPHFREWIEKSSSKVAMAFKSIGEDMHRTRPRPTRKDPTMREDLDEKAEERRRQARQEIMERGKVLQEKRKRRKLSNDSSRTPSFDSLVDERGKLKPEATTSAVEVESANTLLKDNGMRSRAAQPQPMLHESIDSPLQLRQLDGDNRSALSTPFSEPWESRYEQEMRSAWNIELPVRGETHQPTLSSHASESLLDLTPTTEDFPDPDYSIPSADGLHRTDYFSAATSQSHSRSRSISSHTLSDDQPGFYYAHPMSPMTPLEPRPISQLDNLVHPGSSAASVAGSSSRINHSELETTDDDLSEFGDGIRTPASAWTEVGSSVSGDA